MNFVTENVPAPFKIKSPFPVSPTSPLYDKADPKLSQNLSHLAVNSKDQRRSSRNSNISRSNFGQNSSSRAAGLAKKIVIDEPTADEKRTEEQHHNNTIS